MSKSVLLTGASGKVARVIRPYMLAHFGSLVLTDKIEPKSLSPGETFVKADLTKSDEALAALHGVDTAVHFAGLPGEGTWDQVLDASMKTTICALEAARLNGATRFIFASSNHVNGFFRAVRNSMEMSGFCLTRVTAWPRCLARAPWHSTPISTE